VIEPHQRVVEIRTYRLRPGTADEFHRIFTKDVAPLLARHRIDVVRAEPSLVADEPGATYYTLIRAFDSIDDRASGEERLYASDEWRTGPRESVLACIETYHTVVIATTRRAVEELSAFSDDVRIRPEDVSVSAQTEAVDADQANL
jgi:hypothetical protein